MNKQPKRYSDLNLETIEHKSVNWLKMGLVWGTFMFILMTLLMPLITGEAYDLKMILISLPIWAIGGLIFANVMKRWVGEKIS